jgi:hypothetical protein
MSLPFTLPDWVPWWVPLVLLLPALLYALAFLFMPFSVIGVKARLEGLEARLDEIQNEIRHLSLRLPPPGRQSDFDDGYVAQPPPRRAEPAANRPPIPPAPHELDDDDLDDPPPPPRSSRLTRNRGDSPRRTEPRLDRSR